MRLDTASISASVSVASRGWSTTSRPTDLKPGSTRGVSNELLDSEATITLTDGVLLAVQPHTLDPPELPSAPHPALEV